MKKLVATYVYPGNGASVNVFAIAKHKNVPACDTLMLEVTPAKGEAQHICMRPDEALLIIRLLADAVNRTTKSYTFGLQRKGGY